MTIDALPADRNLKLPESSPASSPALAAASALSTSTSAPAPATRTVATSAAASVKADDIHAAVQELQTAISNGPNPDFKLDYLSGLSVVTVRSTITGQVVYQLPDTQALQLARMFRGGASFGSVGLFNTTA